MASSLPENPTLESHGLAIQELTRALEYISKLRGLLKHSPPANDSSLEMADALLRQVLSSLTVVLSVLRPCQRVEVSPPEQMIPLVPPPPSPRSDELGGGGCGVKRKGVKGGDGNRNHKKRSCSNSSEPEVKETDRPYYDGYEWRKYGEKAISGSKFRRNYYRCKYREDQRCLAKKLVQQINENDPPFYRETYTHNHTCKPTHAPLSENILQYSSLPQQKQPFLLHFSSSSSVESKQDLSPLPPLQFQTQCIYSPEICDMEIPCDRTEIPWNPMMDSDLRSELWQW